MNIKEAFSILEVPEGSTPEVIKKSFKKLVAKHHPDKPGGNAESFKKVNEAFQFIETGKDFGPTNQPPPSRQTYGSIPIDLEEILRRHGGGSPFDNNQQRVHAVQDKTAETNISFKESVIGCQKQLSYKRNVKCDSCDGNGSSPIHNGCKVCNGTGTQTQRQGNMIFQQTCSSCGGMRKMQKCTSCKEQGFIETQTTITINIPGGIREGRNILRLQGIGDYAGSAFGGDQYASIILSVKVENNDFLKIEDEDVITNCDISLLEALQGCKKEVHTIDGLKEITIDPLSKNKDHVLLPKLGVNNIGNEKVILNINYPVNLEPLINVLKEI